MLPGAVVLISEPGNASISIPELNSVSKVYGEFL
jgi:hypothetical protein